MKSVKLSNSFHNTSIQIHRKSWMVPENQQLTWMYIEHRAESPTYHEKIKAVSLKNRIKKKLCGMENCTCGTVR